MSTPHRPSALGTTSPVSRRAQINVCDNGRSFAADHLQLPEGPRDFASAQRAGHQYSFREAAGRSSGGSGANNSTATSVADPPFATDGTMSNEAGTRSLLRMFPKQHESCLPLKHDNESHTSTASVDQGRAHYALRRHHSTQANTVLRGATQVRVLG
jgi:hypothetical protein